MADLKELQRKKKEIMMNFNKEDLENYIAKLTFKYYTAILKEDSQTVEYIMGCLNDIVELYDSQYPKIYDFIDYWMLKSSNQLFQIVFKLSCELWTPTEKSMTSNEGFITLSQSIERSRRKIINDRCDVNELYELVSADDEVSDEISEKVFKLYQSFKEFDLGK